MAAMVDDEVTLSEDALKLYRVFKTVNVMLDKRGYIISEEDKNMTKQAFHTKYSPSNFNRASLSVMGSEPETNKKILVFFPNDEKVGIVPINNIMTQMTDASIDHAILIVRVAITPHAKKVMQVGGGGGGRRKITRCMCQEGYLLLLLVFLGRCVVCFFSQRVVFVMVHA